MAERRIVVASESHEKNGTLGHRDLVRRVPGALCDRGEYWAYIWTYLNLPFHIFCEDFSAGLCDGLRYASRALYIAVVTLLNGALLASVVALGQRFASQSRAD